MLVGLAQTQAPQPSMVLDPLLQGKRRMVALANDVSRHFARHRRGRSIESSSNCPKTQSLVTASVNWVAFVHRQLAMVFSHAYPLPNRGIALQSRARHV